MADRLIGGRTRWALVVCAVVVWLGAFAAPAALAQAPVVSGFSPASGTIGTGVTITGSDFTGTKVVSFGSGHASFKVVSASKITAKVPASAASGPISVTNASGTGASSHSFTVDAGVSLSPSMGPPTTTVQVSGAGFGGSEAVDLYFDSSDEVLTTTNATGSFGPIGVPVPASAVPGIHWISAIGRRSGLAAQAAFTVRTDWAAFRFGHRHKGLNPFENVLSPATVSGLDIDWTGNIGGGVFSSPAVAGGVVYVGSDDHKLYAFPASCSGDATCTPLWHATTRGIVETSPAVANGVVYVGSNDDDLYAFPASCGTGNAPCTPLWHATTGNAVRSSPAVLNGVVYVGSDDRKLYAFPASCGTGNATCTPLWHATTGGIVDSSPAVANGVVYVGSFDHKLYAFPASCGTGNATCTPLWHASTGNAVASSPAVANGVVYVGSNDRKLYAFPASCGTGNAPCTPLWHATTGSPVNSSPAVANGVVYVGSFDHDVYAFPASCGTGNAPCTPLWHAPTGGPITFSSPAVANGVVYVASNDRNLYAFDLTTAPLAPKRPTLKGLHPNYTLRPRR
jgi:outer membrane protein assembly factor BamB